MTKMSVKVAVLTNPTPLGWGFEQRTDSALAIHLIKCAAKANCWLVRTPA